MQNFNQDDQQMYQRYAQADDNGDYSSIDPNEAQGNVQQFVQNSSPDEVQQVFQRHFERMNPNDRAQLAQQFPPEYNVDPNDSSSMAQGAARLKQERPDILQGITSHPLMVVGAVGLAALVAKHMLDSRR